MLSCGQHVSGVKPDKEVNIYKQEIVCVMHIPYYLELQPVLYERLVWFRFFTGGHHIVSYQLIKQKAANFLPVKIPCVMVLGRIKSYHQCYKSFVTQLTTQLCSN